ncbi:MAG TPA: efflux RND transporter periplasmic adaptor subunit [Kiritimatiellia bacterium]|nr:efflux RND transporter periplasmic adaptor subunit [Kiritimatiellia bacterium]HRZ13203.1 efflux RND transporter periplasmic adaptor subunit [Kiritimatiellia bacterium]HSA19721.1 efflux RND transporter periplasmic adaptor subunit [Kiritimatiellia bacterium]
MNLKSQWGGPWLAVLLASTAGAQPPPGGGREAAGEPIPVRVMRVEPRDLQQALEYVGDIKARDEAVVYPTVTGKIAEKLKEDGARVRKDEALALVDRDEVGFKFEKAPVKSPLGGIVGRVYVDLGANVTPQTPVALVVNMDQAKINLDIPERYLPRLAPGQVALITVDAYDGIFTGRVSKISPVVDLATRTAPVEILAPNRAHELKPGMFARARLLMEERKGILVVMKEAVLGMAPDQYVYVVEDDTARQRPVRLGLREAHEIEVLEGLTAGEAVVIVGQQRLRDGLPVAVEEAAAP